MLISWTTVFDIKTFKFTCYLHYSYIHVLAPVTNITLQLHWSVACALVVSI